MPDLLRVVREAARAGGLAAVEARERGGLRAAGRGRGGDVSLEGDLAAERAVLEVIERGVGDFVVVSEEAGEVRRGEGRYTFVVDPIDGSRNYGLGIPLFATSVAAATGPTLDDVVAAAVYAPALGIELYAERGRGAYLNGRGLPLRRPSGEPVVSVNSTPKAGALPYALMLVLASRGAVLRNLGAASLELSLVAVGALDAYIDPWFVTRVVDAAAAILIAREAGAAVRVRGALGETPLLSVDERLAVVAAADEGGASLALGALDALGVNPFRGGPTQRAEGG